MQYAQILRDHHLIIIATVITGIAVLLLLLESAIPHIRGRLTLERDLEDPRGQTVSIHPHNKNTIHEVVVIYFSILEYVRKTMCGFAMVHLLLTSFGVFLYSLTLLYFK